VRILELLGAWPAPLAIFLRTPEGQMLNVETRGLIARALGLLGSACIVLGEIGKGEEVLRLGVQYAGDGPMASDVYFRLGSAMLGDGRAGEAIGPATRCGRCWPKRWSTAAASWPHTLRRSKRAPLAPARKRWPGSPKPCARRSVRR
jgi:hypothetical protein